MSNKKNSETLSQRQKAQRDIIELSLMKEGKMETGPKPSEIEKKPETINEKIQNFFYHNKLRVAIIAVIVFALGMGIYSSITRVRYDAKVALFCYDDTIGLYATAMEEYLVKFYDDKNGDGKVKITVVNCSYDKDDMRTNNGITAMGKLQSILGGEEDTLLYIVSKDTIDYLNSISKNLPFFTEENIHKLSDDFINSVQPEGLKKLEGEYYIALRTISGSAIEKEASEYYSFAKTTFEKIKEAN
ncbi:MAG: hypothetical protein IKK77_00925 [Clostridia bacterium]|nr:hypothetical protein [Clostridia bacterium]